MSNATRRAVPVATPTGTSAPVASQTVIQSHHTSTTTTSDHHHHGTKDVATKDAVRDAEMMTSATATTAPTTIVGKIQYYRNQLGALVNHRYTQFIIILFIAINSLMLGLATCAFVKDDAQVNLIFETTDQIFLIIFTVELVCQFIYLGWFLFCDPWLVFDLLLIVSSWVFQDLTVIRSFRIFRTLRLITRIKVMRNLVLALFSVVPRMMAIFFLLTLVSYIFAVMMTQLFKDLYPTDTNSTEVNADGTLSYINYFGRLDASIFTLFQLMTLDAWAEVAEDVMTEYSWAWIPIIVYIIIAGFVVVNLVIAVICDAVSALKEDDKARLHGSYKDSETASDRKKKSTQRKRSNNTNVTAARTEMNGGLVENHHLEQQPQSAQRQLAPVVETSGTSETDGATSPRHWDTSLTSLFDDPLKGLEIQVQELIQLQDATIQNVVSITRQYQKTRMEALSSLSTTPP